MLSRFPPPPRLGLVARSGGDDEATILPAVRVPQRPQLLGGWVMPLCPPRWLRETWFLSPTQFHGTPSLETLPRAQGAVLRSRGRECHRQ